MPLQQLQVVLRLHSPQECSEGVLREERAVLLVLAHCQLEALLGMGSYLEDAVEELLGGLTMDSIPDVLGSEVVLAENLLGKQEAVVAERVRDSPEILADAHLGYASFTACPR